MQPKLAGIFVKYGIKRMSMMTLILILRSVFLKETTFQWFVKVHGFWFMVLLKAMNHEPLTFCNI